MFLLSWKFSKEPRVQLSHPVLTKSAEHHQAAKKDIHSLRSKRFRRAFHRVGAFFAFWTREPAWGERKKVHSPQFSRRQKAKPQTGGKAYGNACHVG